MLPTVTDEELSFARSLPKVELHCHVEGTLRPGTALDLAQKNNLPAPRRMLQRVPNDPVTQYQSLNDFLDDFWIGQALLQEQEDWERLAYEAVESGAANGLLYAEMFFTPASHMQGGQSLESIVYGLSNGLAAAQDKTGVRAMLICDMDRAFGPEVGEDLVQQLAALKGNHRVIGVGMDSTELGVDPLDYLEAFDLAKTNGFYITSHAGEDTAPDNIAAVLSMGVQRIDHGLSVLQDPNLVAMVAAEGVPFTVCPTSNMLIANKVGDIREHPLRKMHEQGINVCVNTDDPGFTGVDLGLEYALLLHQGWDREGMQDLVVGTLDCTWLDREQKARMTDKFQSSILSLPK